MNAEPNAYIPRHPQRNAYIPRHPPYEQVFIYIS